MKPQHSARFFSLALLFAFVLGTSAQADCIDGPKRNPRGWTPWETVYSTNGVDLEVRYHSHFALPGGKGRERTEIQFRYVNRTTADRYVSLSNVHGTIIDGAPFFWDRKSFYMQPFSIPAESGLVEARTIAEGAVTQLDGRICKYTFNFSAR